MIQQLTETSNSERKLASAEIEIEPVEQGQSIVVAIGINKYAHWRKLNNAVLDACSLQQTLIDKLGFIAPIEPLIDGAATKDAIEALVTERLREIVKKDDSLVLFFAGHGHTRVEELSETGFIIPVDARIPDGREYWGDYIRLNHWLQEVSELPARHILVILDACHSGFALGSAMNVFRDAVRYQKDISRNRSRKVITSAKRDQPALDGGPIPGHSLFTGTIINGFNWGEADIDGNGFITSSELGLYLQQKVGQASESRQTPEFGSFLFDDHGEMVISLLDQSFGALKARAFSALQHGESEIFRELVQQIVSLKPFSPEALYLEYRLMLSDNMLTKAASIVDKLYNLRLPDGVIPLSQYDLWMLKNFLNIRNFIHIPESWRTIEFVESRKLTSIDTSKNLNIKLQETNFPVDVELLVSTQGDIFENPQKRTMGNQEVYVVLDESIIRMSMKNITNYPVHVYFMEIDSVGRISSGPLWQDEFIAWHGIAPGRIELSYPFRIIAGENKTGIREVRLFSSKERNYQLLAPPHPSTHIVENSKNKSLDFSNFMNTRMKIIRYIVAS
jgi:hypothetical protein